VLVTEAVLSCTSGMLLCLDREQRLTFILGAIFGVSDTVAAEFLEITPGNFRQRLARARRDLRNFMNDKCGSTTRPSLPIMYGSEGASNWIAADPMC